MYTYWFVGVAVCQDCLQAAQIRLGNKSGRSIPIGLLVWLCARLLANCVLAAQHMIWIIYTYWFVCLTVSESRCQLFKYGSEADLSYISFKSPIKKCLMPWTRDHELWTLYNNLWNISLKCCPQCLTLNGKAQHKIRPERWTPSSGPRWRPKPSAFLLCASSLCSTILFPNPLSL